MKWKCPRCKQWVEEEIGKVCARCRREDDDARTFSRVMGKRWAISTPGSPGVFVDGEEVRR